MMFRCRDSRKTQRGGRRRLLRVEVLEKRLPPAGNVTAAVFGGNLVINGDLEDNDITVDDDALPGRVAITPNGTTTLNGVAVVQVFQATGDIRIRMRGGDDTVVFNGLGGSTPRDLVVDGGDGDNVFKLSHYTVERKLRITGGDGLDAAALDHVMAGGISIDGGEGDIALDAASATVGDDLVVRNGNGSHSIHLETGAVGDDLKIDNGDGGGTISVAGCQVGDNLSIRNGDGDHTVRVDNTTVARDLRIHNDDSTTLNSVAIGVNGPVDVGRDLRLIDGEGDSLTTINAVQVGEDLRLNTGGGVDTVVITGTAVGDLLVNRQTHIETGEGEDSLELGDDIGGTTVLVGAFRLRMGDDVDEALIGEGTVMHILLSSLDGGPGALDILTVVSGAAFDPFDPAVQTHLSNWEQIF